MSEEARKQRIEEINQMRSEGIEPYPYRFEKTHWAGQIKTDFSDLKDSETREDITLRIAGRVVAMRNHGKSTFFVLRDNTDRIQAYIRLDGVGVENFEVFKKFVNIGDFLGVTGFPFKTHTGEISVFVKHFEILSKAIRMMPEKWHGVKDKEIIYRQRYVEMLSSDEALERFRIRSELFRLVREFLQSRGFIEVDTPMLHYLTGGASARPFKTHINVFESEMYLRIAEELFLKRFLVGGFERIFEIGKNFRNEGVSYKHHPEGAILGVRRLQRYNGYH